MNPRVTVWTRARIALGGLALQSSFGVERRQGLGFGAALTPLISLWPDRESRVRFLERHVGNFNTNPAMAGVLLGAIAALEERAAAGDAAALKRIPRLKHALEAPFASAGDGLLWAGLRPGVVMGAGVSSLVIGVWGVAVFLVLYNLVHLGLRIGGVHWGYRAGAEAHRVLNDPGFRLLSRFSGWLVPAAGTVLAAAILAPTSAPGGALTLLVGWILGARGNVRSTWVVIGCIILGLILAYGFGSVES